jgi:hypothetical protein
VRRLGRGLLGLALLVGPDPGHAYPLDGYARTGIARLEAQRLVQEGLAPGTRRPPGELLPLAQVDLRLRDRPDFEIPPPDPELSARLRRLLGPEAERYGLALLDLSEPDRPRYGEWNAAARQNPGSVGKLLVALALFQALADRYPDDLDARRRLLRDTVVTADGFCLSDHHSVPFYDVEAHRLVRRPLEPGDRASLWTYLDWMLSPSSNAAAGMLQKQLLLLRRFGHAYPPGPDEEARFLATPKSELSALFQQAMLEPLSRNGLDPETLRQGGFFTHEGKKRVPGGGSHATARGLIRFLVRMEKGELVDPFSSRELKRLLYVTERRIRYASSAALRDAAVYFKSGSLYSCRPEPGFQCRKYHGNERNFMNSAAVVEWPAGQDRLVYMVVVLSNVLRRNSAEDHRDLARAIQEMLAADHPAPPPARGGRSASARFGEGFVGYAAERRELLLAVETQEALAALGLDVGEVDGVVGPLTRRAIRRVQRDLGLPEDGEPSPELLERLHAELRARGLERPPPAPER